MITSIQLRSGQAGSRTYDALVLQFGGVRFSSDVGQGLTGDLQIRKAMKIAADYGLSLDCFEERLKARIAACEQPRPPQAP